MLREPVVSISTYNTKNGTAKVEKVKAYDGWLSVSLVMNDKVAAWYAGSETASFNLHTSDLQTPTLKGKDLEEARDWFEGQFLKATGMTLASAKLHAELQQKLDERMQDIKNAVEQKAGHSVIQTRQVADGIFHEITLDADDRPTGARLLVNGWVYGKVEVDGEKVTVREWHAMTHTYMPILSGKAQTVAGFRRHLNNLLASYLQRPSNYLTTPDRA